MQDTKNMAEASKSYSEPEYAKLQDQTRPPWYAESIDVFLIPSTQKLLKEYSGIPLDQQSEHVHKIRERAWAIRTYPCTGLGVWLIPYISYSPAYQDVITRLKNGATFMDIGCHLGSDMRRLVFDGAPSSRMYGIDIASHTTVGYDLYKDRDKFKAKFIETDIMSDANADLLPLKGSMDIISLSAVLHQWSWDDQVKAAKRIIEFSKPGTLIVGHQIGNPHARPVKLGPLPETWRHNPASFAKLWDEAGRETGTEWKTQAWLRTWESLNWDPKCGAWMEEGAMVLDFVVTRTT